jgi:hypothetical protein
LQTTWLDEYSRSRLALIDIFKKMQLPKRVDDILTDPANWGLKLNIECTFTCASDRDFQRMTDALTT